MRNYNHYFRITLKQQLLVLSHLLFIILFFIGLKFYVDFFHNWDNDTYYTLLSIFLVIDILPTIILHTQYWIKNRATLIIINSQAKELEYRKKGKCFNYSFSDITALEYYYNLGKGAGWNSFADYRYYKIILKDHNEIIITCLMINNIEITLEMVLHMQAKMHSRFLCLVQ